MGRTSRLLNEERGQAILIGALLIFASIVGLLGMLQASAVPKWNEEIELDHIEAVRNDFYDLRKWVELAAATGFTKTADIKMGVRYPNRMILKNPGPGTSGTLRLAEDKWVYVEYGGENENFQACTVTYTPSYQYAPSQRLIYEHGIVYRMYENYPHTEVQQTLTDGKYVNLLVTGCTEDSTSTRGVLTLNSTPISSPEGSILADNLTIKMKTDFPDWWTGQLNEESGVTATENENNIVTITFDDDVILKMGEVNVSLTEREIQYAPPTQLVKISGDESAIPAGAPHELVAEVRDNYNNPVSEVTVNFEVSDAEVTPESTTTGSDGRATTTLTTSQDITVTAYTPNYNIENVKFEIDVFRTSSSNVEENAENKPLVTDLHIYSDGENFEIYAYIDNAKKYNIFADLVDLTGDDGDSGVSPIKFKLENGSVVAYEEAPENLLRDVHAKWTGTFDSSLGPQEIVIYTVTAYNAGMQSIRMDAEEMQDIDSPTGKEYKSVSF